MILGEDYNNSIYQLFSKNIRKVFSCKRKTTTCLYYDLILSDLSRLLKYENSLAGEYYRHLLSLNFDNIIECLNIDTKIGAKKYHFKLLSIESDCKKLGFIK